MMRSGQGAAAAIGNSTEIREWARQHNLLSDQTAVAELTLASSDWITSIEGRAGAAKTTTVGTIREFAEEKGYAVRGFAPTTRAVKALSEAGIPATTVASLLERRSSRASERGIWIVDESSLLPTRQVNRLLNKANDEGVARVVFVGDQRPTSCDRSGKAGLSDAASRNDGRPTRHTSHSAQGATVDRVIVDIDTRISLELVNRKQFYVSISRARNSVAIYTNNRRGLGHAVTVAARNQWLLSFPLLCRIAVSPFCRNSIKVSVEDTVCAGKSGRSPTPPQ